MDQTHIISAFLNVFIWLFPVAAVIAFLKTPVVKGFMGEAVVNLATALFLDKDEYRLIKNVTLPAGGGTTQIDHIIVSRFGIFVVETKNMKGWIFGQEHQAAWTQVIYKRKTRFQNPLRQNYKHVKTLEKALGLPADKFHSVVVFVGDCTFKTPMPPNVRHPGGYLAFIKSKTRICLSNSEMEEAASRIGSGRLQPSARTRTSHARHVRAALKEKQDQKICPRCGAPMKIRVARKGPTPGKKFWGCSRFPGCRETLNYSGPDL